MALQVWLPFIDSTVDQGCYDLKAPTYTDMTVDQAGKIGSCEKGASIFHLQQDDVVEGDDWTIAGWTKCEETAPTTWYFLSKNSTAGFGANTDLALAISQSKALWGCVGGTAVKSNYTFTTGSWYHIALTATPGQYKFYVNGTCIGSGSQAKTRVTGSCLNIGVGGRSSNAAGTTLYNITNQANIRLNDVRLYDHCLSAREIQEIAKGLVVHYPLNDPEFTNGKVYDCSGYGNHGTPGGTLTTSEDSARYKRSTSFTNTSYIRCLTRPANLPKDAITVNLWMNFSTFGNPMSCTEGGGWNFENASNLRFPVYVAGVGYKLANSGVNVNTLANSWHMLTGTFDKENVKIYIDGVLKGTTPTDSTGSIGYANNWLFLAAEAGANTTTPANSTYVGKLSDVRIYSTALTADQVKELYENPVSVCKSGNLMCMEVVE